MYIAGDIHLEGLSGHAVTLSNHAERIIKQLHTYMYLDYVGYVGSTLVRWPILSNM